MSRQSPPSQATGGGAERPPVRYQTGIPERFRAAAAALYDQAFGKKLAAAVNCGDARRRLLEDGLQLEYALAALAGERLIGLAGLHTRAGSLTGGITAAALLARLGVVKGIRALLIFSLYERKPAPAELVMDGIAVCREARGRGVGGALLEAVAGYAAANGFSRVRLDVIDTNPRARKLYERHAFREVKTEHFPWLRWLLGFGAATTMARTVGG